MKIIAKIHTDFKEKFGIPRQSGIVGLIGKIIFEPEFRNPDSLRGIEGYSHLWLLWNFSESEREVWSPTVRPPRLGGNAKVGVFATRSPFRPNPIGLSSVELIGIEHTKSNGDILIVKGADLLDGTPIYDIKPYLPYTDSHPDARSGFAGEALDYSLKVDIDGRLISIIPEEKREALIKILENDPRPSYKSDGEKEYGMSFSEFEIKFFVTDGVLKVTDINK